MAVTSAPVDARQIATTEPRANASAHSASERVSPDRHATDDEILGLTTPVARKNGQTIAHGKSSAQDALGLDAQDRTGNRDLNKSSQQLFDIAEENGNADAPSAQTHDSPSDAQSSEQPSATKSPKADNTVVAEPEHLRATFDANPELRAAWQDASAYRQTFATPAEARAATALLADLNHLDALFFSRQPADHAQLARAVAELDPVAFASLARAMTQVAQPAGASFPAIAARSASTASHSPVGAQHAVPGKDSWRDAAHSTSPNSSVIPRSEATKSLSSGAAREIPRSARDDNGEVVATNAARSNAVADNAAVINAAPSVTPAQEQFFHATNAAAVEGVLESIESQVERLLPEGISKSARNRVVGEIYREVDSTLRSNRVLAQQMRQAFRSGALDAEHQNAIVSLITNRARQALPGVAKRVLNEWTTTVVSANRQRRERQRTAERRIDIAGSGGAANDGRHSMGPRDINYARMSDADILNL